jgi:hypothetical protein
MRDAYICNNPQTFILNLTLLWLAAYACGLTLNFYKEKHLVEIWEGEGGL